MIDTSLPLFDDPAPAAATPVARAAPEHHLQAARRLSKRMARLADQSPEQVRAGHLICRHLIAMLEQAQTAETTTSH
jgi:hypothetical protein